MRVQDLPIPHQDGSFVSAKVTRIVELIREYSSDLDVRWIHPDHRTDGEAAFCIVERGRDGIWRTAFLVQTEDEMDERVLQRIYMADSRKHDIAARDEAGRKAMAKLKQKEFEDAIADAHDKAKFLWRTPKHSVRFEGQRLEL